MSRALFKSPALWGVDLSLKMTQEQMSKKDSPLEGTEQKKSKGQSLV